MVFDFATWRKMVRLAARERSPKSRRRLLVRLLVKVPLAAAFHLACLALDPLLFPSLRRTRVVAPVFIVGHARSGTTLLHRLMVADPGRFSAFRLYELWLPSLLQKKAVRLGARLDAALLGGALERRVRAWEERKFAPTRHIHPQSLGAPEEDEAVLEWACASGTWMVSLPYMHELDFYHLDRQPPRRRRAVMRLYEACVRRQLAADGPAADGGVRTYLSKNPNFSGRVESLIEHFPDARIVVPFRNPYETIPSLLKLMKTAWGLRGWSEAEMQGSLRVLAEQSAHTYQHPLEVLARHPETRRAVVDYAELTAEPRKVIERVYRELGLPMTPAFERVLDAEQLRARRHEGRHRYSLEEFGLDGDAIHRELADLFERFHWDAAPGAAAAQEEGRT